MLHINFVTLSFENQTDFPSKPELFQDKRGHWKYFNKKKGEVDGNSPTAKFMQWVKD